MTQRDMMRKLYRLNSGDKRSVIKAYGEAENRGEVERRNNRSKSDAESYACALWEDGIKKGWLAQPFLKTNTSSDTAPQTEPRQLMGKQVENTPLIGADLLVNAALLGDTGKVKNLLRMGTNPNEADEDGSTALHWSAYKGHFSVASELLKHGASVNAQDEHGQTPLALASCRGYIQVVDI